MTNVKKIKIMNYNILHGFHKVEPPYSLEKERLKNAQGIISQENPDILVLTEACYGGENPFDVFLDYKKIFNFPYGFFGKWGEYEWGNFILSKYPIEAKTIPYGERTAIKSKIDINGKEIFLDVIHPSPFWNEEDKIKFTKNILEKNPKNYFLVGDFNSISEEDKYDKNTLINGFKKFDKTPEKSVNKLLERKFISWLKSLGLKDTARKSSRVSTVPTKIYGKNLDSSLRVDFIFSSKDINVIDTKVIKNKLTDFSSDHYPVVGTYEVII